MLAGTYELSDSKKTRSPEKIVHDRLLRMKCDPLRGMVRCIQSELANPERNNALLFHMYEKLMKWSTLRTVSIALPVAEPVRNERVIDLQATHDFSNVDSKSLLAAINAANKSH